jgi:3-deoxy-D-manno-octulosonic-acid transferase
LITIFFIFLLFNFYFLLFNLKLLYHIFLHLYPLAAKLISPWNAKAQKWVLGRKNWQSTIAGCLQTGARNAEALGKATNKQPNQGRTIWVHCASLGEFEQGRPLIESIRHQYPNNKIIISFFSPSGYEVQKNYAMADHVFYLPMDGAANAKDFLELIQPQLVIFVKYEYWLYYLTKIQDQKIPLLMVSGIFRKDQAFFKWYGGFYQKMLAPFTHFFVQNNNSLQLIQQLGFANASLAGDTRFDRVLNIRQQFVALPAIEAFVGQHPTIVAGSTWTEDDEELDHYINTHPNIRCIVAPHDVDPERIEECKKLYKHSILYSEWVALADPASKADCNTLIIDNVGMLSRLYHYATIALVGGGFTADGVHNVLEPAVFGKPIVHGPEFDKYQEAVDLVQAGAAFDFDDALDLEALLDELLEDGEKYANAAKAAANYVQQQTGATQMIMQFIQKEKLI